jgi:ABC-type sugar transport system ATPase subunit
MNVWLRQEHSVVLSRRDRDPRCRGNLFRRSLAFSGKPAVASQALAYLTQSDWLFPHLSVAENVCFGLQNHDRDGARKWIEELAKRLDLRPLWNESARLISGGQARRVALARMLARRPPSFY